MDSNPVADYGEDRQEDGQSIAQQAERDAVNYAASSVMVPMSQKSQMTSKTYISQLEKQLLEEKTAREKLQGEIEQIKKVNAEISSKLGLSSQNTMQ